MPEMSAEQVDWVKNALGFDIAGATGRGQGEPAASRKGPFSGLKARMGKAKPAKPPVAAAVTDVELAKKLKALTDEVAGLKKRGFNTRQMQADGADFASSGATAEALTDPAARTKALESLYKRVDDEVVHAKALAKSLKDIVGDTDKPSQSQKSAIYKKALEECYGLTIEVPAGMKNTHFDRMFDMFGTVPKSDTKQDQLKKLTYVKTDTGGVFYSDGTIEMGNYGKAEGSEDYEIDGKKLPANSFNVTALHEIGHSVDQKHNIMGSNRTKAGCGNWKPETVGSVATGFLADLKASAKLSDKVTDDMLTAAINTALSAGTTTQPATIGNADWKHIVKFLVHKCLPVRDAAQPYFKSTPVVTGDRVFTEAAPGEWWSYASAARTSTKVNNYQWRSPGEWFAEVYAISWLKKRKPPSGVDAAVAEYMWKG